MTDATTDTPESIWVEAITRAEKKYVEELESALLGATIRAQAFETLREYTIAPPIVVSGGAASDDRYEATRLRVRTTVTTGEREPYVQLDMYCHLLTKTGARKQRSNPWWRHVHPDAEAAVLARLAEIEEVTGGRD